MSRHHGHYPVRGGERSLRASGTPTGPIDAFKRGFFGPGYEPGRPKRPISPLFWVVAIPAVVLYVVFAHPDASGIPQHGGSPSASAIDAAMAPEATPGLTPADIAGRLQVDRRILGNLRGELDGVVAGAASANDVCSGFETVAHTVAGVAPPNFAQLDSWQDVPGTAEQNSYDSASTNLVLAQEDCLFPDDPSDAAGAGEVAAAKVTLDTYATAPHS